MDSSILIQIVRRFVCAAILLAISLAPLQAMDFGASGGHAKVAAVSCEKVQSCQCDDAMPDCSTASACFAACGSMPMLGGQDRELAGLVSGRVFPARGLALAAHSLLPLRRPPRT